MVILFLKQNKRGHRLSRTVFFIYYLYTTYLLRTQRLPDPDRGRDTPYSGLTPILSVGKEKCLLLSIWFRVSSYKEGESGRVNIGRTGSGVFT